MIYLPYSDSSHLKTHDSWFFENLKSLFIDNHVLQWAVNCHTCFINYFTFNYVELAQEKIRTNTQSVLVKKHICNAKQIQLICFLNNHKKENKKPNFSLVESFSGFSRWCTVWMSVCLWDIFCCREPGYNSVHFGWAIRPVQFWQANRLLFIVCTSSECSKGWIALFALVWE